MAESDKEVGAKVGGQKPVGNVTPIYLGGLNAEFIRSCQYVVTEYIQLDTNGAAEITRRTEECIMSVPRSSYNDHINRLRRSMPGFKFSEPNFEVNHRFIPTHLMSYSACTIQGMELIAREVREFGSTIIKIALPIKVEVQDNYVSLHLPGYLLHVGISQLAVQLETMWYLQWSHGAAGPTNLYLNLTIPSLKKGILKTIFYSQFLFAEPVYQNYQYSAPIMNWLREASLAIGARFKRRVKIKRPGPDDSHQTHSLPEENQSYLSEWPKLKSKTHIYTWARARSDPGTISIHVAYGLRYRKRIFSPIGFVLSGVLAVILTILLTDPLKHLIKFIKDWF